MNEPSSNERKSGFFDLKSNMRALSRIAVLLAVLLGAIWLVVRFSAGEKAANEVTSTILQRPIELQNTIQNLPASSIKWLGLNVTYAGTVSVDVLVRKGNDIDVYVVTADEIEKVKKGQQFTSFTAFNAQKTKTYKRASRLAAGGYYLVLMDKSLGVLSQSSSDVQILAKLEP